MGILRLELVLSFVLFFHVNLFAQNIPGIDTVKLENAKIYGRFNTLPTLDPAKSYKIEVELYPVVDNRALVAAINALNEAGKKLSANVRMIKPSGSWGYEPFDSIDWVYHNEAQNVFAVSNQIQKSLNAFDKQPKSTTYTFTFKGSDMDPANVDKTAEMLIPLSEAVSQIGFNQLEKLYQVLGSSRTQQVTGSHEFPNYFNLGFRVRLYEKSGLLGYTLVQQEAQAKVEELPYMMISYADKSVMTIPAATARTNQTEKYPISTSVNFMAGEQTGLSPDQGHILSGISRSNQASAVMECKLVLGKK